MAHSANPGSSSALGRWALVGVVLLCCPVVVRADPIKEVDPREDPLRGIAHLLAGALREVGRARVTCVTTLHPNGSLERRIIQETDITPKAVQKRSLWLETGYEVD